ncbi:possible dehydrogenase [Plesiocystis pacifica SIR-1]|uniref:Possible dehydrogenase n=2 Tax=Plesiocystis pacifica TaxID=191768 RepID=A6G6M7_9BACT|nr:possible dehydrogenase [Plesiocystis pacifica SIR-1]
MLGAMSLMSRLKRPGPSGFGYGSTAEQVTEGLDLSGKVYLLTGSNSGLGLETLRVLNLRGATVIATARTQAKAEGALRDAGASERGVAMACELSEPSSVRACVEAVNAWCGEQRPLAGIIANAGIMALPKLQLKFGYELQFFTNHIGHFMLVNGVLDSLAPDGRVVMLASSAHQGAPRAEGIQFDNLDGRKGYAPWANYGQSKLANLLFARELDRRLAASEHPQRSANAVHPGVIPTPLGRHVSKATWFTFSVLGKPFLKTVHEGAATQCFVATHASVGGGGLRGQYFADSNVAESSAHGSDMALAAKLWQVSEEIVAGL